MTEQIKLIAARRSYEFRPDDLRLSLVCTQPVQQVIQQTFSFTNVQIGTPLPMVEEVPATIPPGSAMRESMTAKRSHSSATFDTNVNGSSRW